MADRVGVVIPWRGGCQHREAALAWCSAQWPWPVVIGECGDGPWVKAHAVADGLAKTDVEVLVIADADVVVDTHLVVADVVDGWNEWGYPHRGIRRLHQAATVEVLAGRLDPAEVNGSHLVEPGSRAHAGGGVLVVRRETYERVPFDPRFAGWGSEDDSLGWALETLAGAPCRGRERLVHLWHPPQPRRSRQRGSEASYALQERYWQATKDPAAMRALIEEAKEVVGHEC